VTELVEGNRIALLCAGAEYFPALEAACDGARYEIHVETYIFDGDAAGTRIANALMRAAERGVDVHLLVDGYGSRQIDKALVEAMRTAGVRYLVYRPDIAPWRYPRQRLRRMHRKLAVIDGAVAFVGGINIIDDMHTPRHKPPRIDYAVRIEGPLVREIHPVVKRLWTLVEFMQLGESWPKTVLPPRDRSPGGRQRAAFLVRDNLRHRSDIEEAYLSAIARARSEIVIACAYFFPGRRFRRALLDAVARGVRVVLLLQGRVEYVLLHFASRALYGPFLEAGIEIHEYHRSFLHAKVAVIDGHWATVGSSNIDPFSLLMAREANVVVEDRQFAGELFRRLQGALVSGARQLKPEGWRERPLLLRAAIWISYGAARLLTGLFAYGRVREFN
jgi:cardiolipin synthase